MKPGINVMEPKKEARRTPINLFSLPRYVEMILSSTRERTIETRIIMVKKAGKMFTNLLAAILNALSVFSRFTRKEINTANPVAMYK